MKHTIILGALAALTLSSSCALMAGAAAGGVVYNEFAENKIYEAQFNMDSEAVWHSAKATVSHTATDPIEVDRDLRKLVAKIDGAVVIVTVETFDLDQSILRIEAKRYGIIDGEVASRVLTKIREGLEGEL